MKWLNYLRAPNFEITVTVFQALVLLAEKYKGDTSSIKKYEVIKHLCLSGVCTPKDKEALDKLLEDSLLARYRISARVEDINADPVRRYFESQLCHKTLSNTLDSLDIHLLEHHMLSIVGRLDHIECEEIVNMIYKQPAEAVNKYSEGIFTLSRADSYQSLRPESSSGRASPDKTESPSGRRASPDKTESPSGGASPDQVLNDRKKKMRFLDGAMYAAKRESDTFGVLDQLAALRYQKGGVYDAKNRERERKRDAANNRTQCIASDRQGIMSFTMPLPFYDDLRAETTSQYTRSVDKFYYVRGNGNTLVGVNQVSPFVGSISGTFLIKLSMIAQLMHVDKFVYQSEPQQLKLFLKTHIAYMLYQAGGHSLDEYVRVLQLPEVQAEFKALLELSSVTLESLFKTDNEIAFDEALIQTITYNHTILNTKKMQAELTQKKHQAAHPNFLGVMPFFLGKQSEYTVVNHSTLGYIPLFLIICLLDEKRLSTEKDISLTGICMRFFCVASALVIAASFGDELVEAPASLVA